jgi:hypothetical protein
MSFIIFREVQEVKREEKKLNVVETSPVCIVHIEGCMDVEDDCK